MNSMRNAHSYVWYYSHCPLTYSTAVDVCTHVVRYTSDISSTISLTVKTGKQTMVDRAVVAPER